MHYVGQCLQFNFRVMFALLIAAAALTLGAGTPLPADDAAWLRNETMRLLAGCQLVAHDGRQPAAAC